MDDFSYVDPSAQALFDKRIKSWLVDYDHIFLACPVGKSFSLPLSIGKLSSVRSAVSRVFNKNGKKFKIVKHNDCYEVYRKM